MKQFDLSVEPEIGHPMTALPQPSVIPLNSIQLLRGVAVLMVVVYHISLLSASHFKTIGVVSQLFGQGYAGVDLFFVISGFVITYSSFPKGRKSPAVLNYISKRLIRIFPIYWGMALIFWVTCHVLYGGLPQSGRLIGDWLAAIFLVPTHLPIMPISWSLSHELFFYFLIGLIVYSRNLLIVSALVIAGTIYHLTTTQSAIPVYWFMFNPYNLEFLGGALVALLYGTQPYHKSVYWALLLVSIAWLFVGPVAEPGNQESRLLLYGLSSIGIIRALTVLERSRQISIAGGFIKLGNASYIIYLLHSSALVVLYKIVEKWSSLPFWLFICLSISLVVGVSISSLFIHQYLEKPLLDRLNRQVMRRYL